MSGIDLFPYYKPIFILERKCRDFMKSNLRAPPWRLVLTWGNQLKLSRETIKDVSEKLALRHALLG